MTRADVEHRIRRWASVKGLPQPYLQKWLALDETAQKRLLELAEHLRMHTGQFITSLSLLGEIAIREAQPVSEVLDRPSLRRVIDSTGSGPGRARAMIDQLRTLRYPRLKRASERLAIEVTALKLPSGIKVILAEHLASDEVRIEVVAHGSAELQQLLALLAAKSSALVRVADILTGANGEGASSE
jgi:hypothetical protein